MMELIIKDKIISFKKLEKNIFKYIYQCGCEMTRIILEDNDKDIEKAIDKKVYRHKGTHLVIALSYGVSERIRFVGIWGI